MVGVSVGGVVEGGVVLCVDGYWLDWVLVEVLPVVVVELPAVAPGEVDGELCCAIAPLANIAETTSAASRTDLIEELFIVMPRWGMFPQYSDGIPKQMGATV